MSTRYRYPIGSHVRPRRELRNGYGAIPAGTIMEVTKRFRGYNLIAVDKCECCGFRPIITRVHQSDLDPV